MELNGTPIGIEPYIGKVIEIIQKALTDAGLQATIYRPDAIKQRCEGGNVWYTDIDVRLLFGISARVEPIGPVDARNV